MIIHKDSIVKLNVLSFTCPNLNQEITVPESQIRLFSHATDSSHCYIEVPCNCIRKYHYIKVRA